MNTEALKEIYRRYWAEVWVGQKLELAENYFTADFLDHAAPPFQGPGVEGLKQVFAYFFNAFPDGNGTIEDLIAEGDKLVVRLTFRGTHQGEFFGIPATGKSVSVSQTHIFRFSGEKMAEHWSNSDDLGMLRQLGAIPG